jgi:LacI family transcriptional regulator
MRTGKVTIKDVAKECGVSASTVGYILGGSNTYKFKPETKKLVEDAAAKLKYRPNPIAASFRKQKNNIIIGIVGNVYRYVDAIHVKSLEKEFRKHGYNLVVQFLTGMTDQDKIKFFKKVYLWGGGIVIIDFGVTNEKYQKELAELLENAPPTVSLFHQLKGSKANYAQVNWRNSFGLVADYLKKEQRRFAGCCTGFEEQSVFEKFSPAMNKQKIDSVLISPDKSVGYCNYYKAGHIIAEKILAMDKIPDALYCISDEITFSIVQALQRKGIKIPEDILMVSGGDSDFYQWFNFPTPVLLHDIEALTQSAANDLIERIEKGEQSCGSGKCTISINQKMIFQ